MKVKQNSVQLQMMIQCHNHQCNHTDYIFNRQLLLALKQEEKSNVLIRVTVNLRI